MIEVYNNLWWWAMLFISVCWLGVLGIAYRYDVKMKELEKMKK